MSESSLADASLATHLDLRTLLVPNALDPTETENWIKEQPTPVDFQGFEAHARSLLRELWELLVNDLAAGVVISTLDGRRVVTVANTIEFHIDATSHRIDACNTHPRHGNRWFAFDLSSPLRELFWADRVLERHSELWDRLDNQLRLRPVDQVSGDASFAAAVDSLKVWHWANCTVRERLHRTFDPVPLRAMVVTAFDLNRTFPA